MKGHLDVLTQWIGENGCVAELFWLGNKSFSPLLFNNRIVAVLLWKVKCPLSLVRQKYL